jgi:hypothetical protein
MKLPWWGELGAVEVGLVGLVVLGFWFGGVSRAK